MSFDHTFPIIPGEMADGKGNTCIDFPQRLLQADTFDWTLDFQQTDVMERQTHVPALLGWCGSRFVGFLETDEAENASGTFDTDQGHKLLPGLKTPVSSRETRHELPAGCKSTT